MFRVTYYIEYEEAYVNNQDWLDVYPPEEAWDRLEHELKSHSVEYSPSCPSYDEQLIQKAFCSFINRHIGESEIEFVIKDYV